MSSSSELLICDYTGTARSGKGTIVKHLRNNYQGYHQIKIEETGIDYRGLARYFLERSWLDEHTPGETLEINRGSLAEILAGSRADISERGEAALRELYQEPVNRIVAEFGAVPLARTVVKTALVNRVEAIRDSGEYDLVLLDGRNLGDAVKNIAGTRLLLRTFVTCQRLEAALRQCTEAGMDFDSPEGLRVLEDINIRNTEDKNRRTDPVRHDKNAVDYWQASEGYHRQAVRRLMDCTTIKEYAAATKEAEGVVKEPPQKGLGEFAVKQSRQILFDTTPFRAFADPKGAMEAAAMQMFEEALRAA